MSTGRIKHHPSININGMKFWVGKWQFGTETACMCMYCILCGQIKDSPVLYLPCSTVMAPGDSTSEK